MNVVDESLIQTADQLKIISLTRMLLLEFNPSKENQLNFFKRVVKAQLEEDLKRDVTSPAEIDPPISCYSRCEFFREFIRV